MERQHQSFLGVMVAGFVVSMPVLGWSDCGAEAEQHYQKGTQVSRKYTDQGQACQVDCWEEKRYFYQQAVARCPTHAKANNNLGNALERLGRYDAAETHYTKAVELDPTFAVAYFGLGDLYVHTRRYSQAIDAYDQGLTLEPDDPLANAQRHQAECLRDAAIPSADCIRAVLGGEPMPTMGLSGIKPDRRLPLTIPFAVNEADFLPEAQALLRELGTAIKEIMTAHPTAAFLIEGHTDVRGHEEYNLQLSAQRAELVASHVSEAYQVPLERLRVKGYGESRLLTKGMSETDHARNRRVEVVRLDVNELNAADNPLTVDVGVFYEDADSRPQKLKNEAVLRSGDGYRLFVEAHQASYVYIFQIDAAGQLFHLFPNPKYGTENNFIPAQSAHWVPGRDLWFELDDIRGQEEIYVVASRERREDIEDLIKRYTESEVMNPESPERQELRVVLKTMGVRKVRSSRAVEVSDRKGGVVTLSPDRFSKEGLSLVYRFAFFHE